MRLYPAIAPSSSPPLSSATSQLIPSGGVQCAHIKELLLGVPWLLTLLYEPPSLKAVSSSCQQHSGLPPGRPFFCVSAGSSSPIVWTRG